MTMLFPPGALPKGPPVDAQKALLLIDFQNDFVNKDGKLPVPNVSNFMSNIPSLANKFRSQGSVIWVRTEYAQSRLATSPETGFASILLKQNLETGSDKGSHRSIIQHDSEAFLDRSYSSNDARPCMPGTTGAELPPTLSSVVNNKVDKEVVKSDYSAFAETALLLLLRTRLITHIYVCGSLSNISVYATVLDAVRHGLEVTLVEDCLGHLESKCHFEAMRQMADDMGASGVDYQELMDDLSGLLGDIVREEDFSSRFQVSMQQSSIRPRATVPPVQRNQRVEEWIASAGSKRRKPAIEPPGNPSKTSCETGISLSDEPQVKTKASKVSSKKDTPELSPPRKRSTSDIDNTDESLVPPSQPSSSVRRELPNADGSQRMIRSKPRLRNTRSSQDSYARPPQSLILQALQSKSTSDIPDKTGHMMLSDTDSQGRSLASPKMSSTSLPQPKKQKKNRQSKEILGPADTIGDGDCRLICDTVPPAEADDIFHKLRDDVRWQRMYHRSGEVPRLVAVQGHIQSYDKEVPIYRHPVDESPELLPFDRNVDALRQVAEKHIGHPLNHVLIQWYRSGEDNISEHSDKTLDIVRGSSIVNMSFGAQRTMTLRTKKELPTPTAASRSLQQAVMEVDEMQLEAAPRMTQRVPLPHNSLFVLGQKTNQHWLHAIRADKRLVAEKTSEELAFGGERISLTFRHIGTFINTSTITIWGQGARAKTREEAKPILSDEEAEREGERMIKAFGMENHNSREWVWEEWYGSGFDVVDFEGHAQRERPNAEVVVHDEAGTELQQTEHAMVEPKPAASVLQAGSALQDAPELTVEVKEDQALQETGLAISSPTQQPTTSGLHTEPLEDTSHDIEPCTCMTSGKGMDMKEERPEQCS